MKIAQIAPLIERVPPRLYGGTERIVSYLAEELVGLGHDVTVFASGNSVTSARLVSCTRTALRLDRNVRDPIPYYMLMLDRVRECADDFDILHFHIDQFHFPLSLRQKALLAPCDIREDRMNLRQPSIVLSKLFDARFEAHDLVVWIAVSVAWTWTPPLPALRWFGRSSTGEQ